MLQEEKSKQIKTGIILSYALVVISFIVNFIYSPILTKFLGQSHYGTYSLIISIVGYLEILNNGMSSTYIKFAAKYINKDAKKLSDINGIIFIIYIIFAIIACATGIILIFNLENIFIKFSSSEIKEMKVMLTIMLVNIFVTALAGVFESYIILNERFIFNKIFLIIKKVILPIIVIPLLLTGYKSIMVVIVTTLISVVSLIINANYCKKKLSIKITFSKIEKGFLKEIVIFYVFIILTIVIDQINWSIDSIIIGMKRSAAEVAVYTIASQINSIYLAIATAISGVFVPRIHFIVNKNKNEDIKNEELLKLVIKTGRIQCMVIFLILFNFVFFGDHFLLLLYGQEYRLAYVVTLLLIVPVTFAIIKGNVLEVYRAKDKQKVRTLIYFIIAIINVIVSYFACQKYGIIGSAAGTTASIIIGHIIIFNFYDHFVIKFNMLRFWKEISKIFLAFIIPIVSGCIIYKVFDYNNLIVYLSGIIIFSLIYLLSIYFVACNNLEKQEINTIIKKCWGKIKVTSILQK